MKTLFAIAFAGITATAVIGCAHKPEAAPMTPAAGPDMGAAQPESAPVEPAGEANRPPPN